MGNILSILSVAGITSSKGVFRTISATLAALAAVSNYYPELAPYTEILVQLAGVFGVTGIAKASAKQFK